MTMILISAVSVSMCAIMALAWLTHKRTGQSGWVDVFWTFGVGLTSMVLALQPSMREGLTWRQMIVAALIAFWSLRLGSHITVRTIRSPDDPRYARLREEWGADAGWRMFWFLQIQAVMALLLALTVMAAAHAPRVSPDWRDIIGAAVMFAAITGEGIADWQIKAFARDPCNKGQVCDKGLWRWSRHPNYFFEWLGWLVYPIIAIEISTAYPWGWFALVGPALMYWLLVHVSGIPPLEEHMLRSRGNKFRAYQSRTNAFFPYPPSEEK